MMRLVVSRLKDSGVKEREACLAIDVERGTIRYSRRPEDPLNVWLRDKLRYLSTKHKTYGTPFMTAMVRKEKAINHKRVERIWKEEGLPAPRKRKKRMNRLPMAYWPGYGEKPFQTWSMDFVHHRTEYGQKLKILSVVDDFSRTCLELRVEKRFRAVEVIETLDELFSEYGEPDFIRSDNGPEFISELLGAWLTETGVMQMHIERAVRGRMDMSKAFMVN